MKFELEPSFSQFIQRFKIETFECWSRLCVQVLPKLFPIHKAFGCEYCLAIFRNFSLFLKDGKLDFSNVKSTMKDGQLNFSNVKSTLKEEKSAQIKERGISANRQHW